MATFPTFDGISPQSSSNPDAGLNVRLSEGGNVHGRQAYSATVYRWTIIYELLDATDRAELDTFYETNKENVNAVTIDGTTYDVRFVNKPMPTEYHGLYRTMTVEVIGHEQ